MRRGQGYDSTGSGSAKGLMVLIVFIALALTLGLNHSATGAPKAGKQLGKALAALTKQKRGSGPSLAGMLAGIVKGIHLPSIGKPKKPAKVPHGLSFTNGAGCRPKGDWNRVDSRVRTVLLHAAKRYKIRVSCLHTGHSRYVKGTRRVSNHTAWRAVDIDQVNGRPVRYGNRAARNLALLLGHGRMGAQPSELGSPWFTAGRFFTDAGHKNHLHVGFGSR